MGDQLFKWLRDFIYLIIPGLIYFVDMIIVLKSSTSINFCEILEKNQSFPLYLAIVIVLIAYVFGYSIDLATRGIYWICHLKESRRKFKNGILSKIKSANNDVKTYHEISIGYYSSFIMIRNLGLSLLILFLLILFPQITKKALVPICIIFLMALISAYLLLRDQVKLINEINPIEES